MGKQWKLKANFSKKEQFLAFCQKISDYAVMHGRKN